MEDRTRSEDRQRDLTPIEESPEDRDLTVEFARIE